MSTTIQKLDSIRQDLTQDASKRVNTLLDLGNKVYLAGLGIVATAQQETTAAYEKAMKRAEKQADVLVKRGEKLDHQRAVKFESIRAGIETQGRAVAKRVDRAVVQPTMSVASRLGMPSRGEVRTLNANVAALTAKVDALVARLGELPALAEPTILVMADAEGWVVSMEGIELPLSSHDTKEAAVEQARAVATERAPSQLVIYKKDGTVQDKISYHA